MARVRIGTRASALARWQSETVAAPTPGDDLAEAPLERMEGTGFFTSTLEHALLDGRIDVAVHSYKDLPVLSTPGLAIAAVPARGPVEDTLCAREGLGRAGYIFITHEPPGKPRQR